MKAFGSTLLVLISLSAPAFAQSDALHSFDTLKSLAGSWEGTVTTIPPAPEVQGKTVQVTLRVTSMGNALLHEMHVAGRPDDPITMLYLEGDRLLLTHYCDAGNRPRMTGSMAADGKTLEFSLLDVAGGTEHGHMHNAVFSPINADHHTEEWNFMTDDKDSHVRARFDLRRVK